MEALLHLLSMLVAACSVWWLIRRMLRIGIPAEPAEDPFAGDPLAEVSVPVKRNPQGRAGAVAMEEPEEEARPDLFLPRTL